MLFSWCTVPREIPCDLREQNFALLSLLIYGSECLNYSSSYYAAIRRSWNYIFLRLFRINRNSSVITEVCNWTHIMNIDAILCKRSNNFKLKILNSSNTVMSSLCDVV